MTKYHQFVNMTDYYFLRYSIRIMASSLESSLISAFTVVKPANSQAFVLRWPETISYRPFCTSLMFFFAPPKHRKSFCALVGAFHSASPPKHTKGNHLTLESESSPWAFHPCRVLRQLRREVSLSYLNPRRLVGGNPTLETAFLAQHLCSSPHRLPRFVPLAGQVVTAYCPPGSGPEECIR